MKKTILWGITLIASLTFLPTHWASAEETRESDMVIAGVLLHDLTFYKDIESGMKDYAGKQGINLLTSSSDSDVKVEERLINSFINLGVSAIAIAPAHPEGSVAALKRAHDMGIKIIIYNNTLKADFPVTTVASSQKQLGVSTGEEANRFIKEHLKRKAKLAVLEFYSILPMQSRGRVDGFLGRAKEGIEEDSFEVVAQKDAWLSDQALKVAGQIIADNPDLDILYSANEGGTVGAQLAVKAAGKEDKIKVFGTDASMQLIQMLMAQDNILQAVTAQQPFKMGFEAIRIAAEAVNEHDVPKNVVVPGILISRQKPEELKAHLKALKDKSPLIPVGK